MRKKAKTGRPRKSPETAQKYTLGVRLSAVEHMLLSAWLEEVRRADPLSSAPVTMTGLIRSAALNEAKKGGFDVVRGHDGKLSVTRATT
jgi:hypothetical protein